MRATPHNYPHKPLPDDRARLQCEGTLIDEQYRALTRGIIPDFPEEGNRAPEQYDSDDDATDAIVLDRPLDGIIETNLKAG